MILQNEVRELTSLVDSERIAIASIRSKLYNTALKSSTLKFFDEDSIYFKHILIKSVDLDLVLPYLNFISPTPIKKTLDSLKIEYMDTKKEADFSKVLLDYFDSRALNIDQGSKSFKIIKRKKKEFEKRIQEYKDTPKVSSANEIRDAIVGYIHESKISALDVQLSILHSMNPGDSFYIDCGTYLSRNSFKVEERLEGEFESRCEIIKQREIESKTDPSKEVNWNGFGGFFQFERKNSKDFINVYLEEVEEAQRLSILDDDPESLKELKEKEKEINSVEVLVRSFENEEEIFRGSENFVVLKDEVVKFNDARYEYELDVFGKIVQKGDSRVTLGHYEGKGREGGRLYVDYGGGEKCWGVGERIARVWIECSDVNEVRVSENEERRFFEFNELKRFVYNSNTVAIDRFSRLERRVLASTN